MGNIIYAKANVGSPAAPPPTPPGSTDCVDFDGTTSETLQNNNEDTYGIVDNWTWMTWLKKAGDHTTSQHMFRYTAPGEGNSNTIRWAGHLSFPDRLNLIVYAADGNHRTFVLEDYFAGLDNTWVQVVVTWDGPLDLKLYRDASNVTPGSIGGTGGAQTDTGRIKRSGYGFNGKYYSEALWNVTLDQDNITAIFNSGDGTSFDLLSDSGNYDQSSALKHWWVPGTDQTSENAIGTDYGTHTNLFNQMDNATNITIADDIVADSPT